MDSFVGVALLDVYVLSAIGKLSLQGFEMLAASRAALDEYVAVKWWFGLERESRRTVEQALRLRPGEVREEETRRGRRLIVSPCIPIAGPRERVDERFAERLALERCRVRMLFERTAISKKPELTIEKELAALSEGQVSESVVLKDPYLLDFLDLNDSPI